MRLYAQRILVGPCDEVEWNEDVQNDQAKDVRRIGEGGKKLSSYGLKWYVSVNSFASKNNIDKNFFGSQTSKLLL